MSQNNLVLSHSDLVFRFFFSRPITLDLEGLIDGAVADEEESRVSTISTGFTVNQMLPRLHVQRNLVRNAPHLGGKGGV